MSCLHLSQKDCLPLFRADQSFIFIAYFTRETGSFICFQFLIVMHYLSIMTDEQTLVMYSGHPLGLFPSSPSGPRAVITNGMVGIFCKEIL